jgi:hypothetical protein
MPLIEEVVAEILASGDVVTPIELLVRLEILTPEQVEEWKTGELPYLERAITVGLSRVARLLRLLREHALALELSPTPGKYLRRGKGPKRRLRFSKRGDAESEAAYSVHFVRARSKA